MSKPALKVVSNNGTQVLHTIEETNQLNQVFDYIKIDLDLTRSTLVFNYKNGHRFYAALSERARDLTRSVEQYADWDVYIDLKDPDTRNKGDLFGKLRRPAIAGKSNKRSKGRVIPFTAVKVDCNFTKAEVWVGSQHYEIPLRQTDPSTKHGKSFQLTGRLSVYEDVVDTPEEFAEFLASIRG